MPFILNRDEDNKISRKRIVSKLVPTVGSISITNPNNVILDNLVIGEDELNAQDFDELEYLDTLPGVVEASKALVIDKDLNISNINKLSCNSLYLNGTKVDPLTFNLLLTKKDYSSGITLGIGKKDKMIALDDNLSVTNINYIESKNLTFNDNVLTGDLTLSPNSSSNNLIFSESVINANYTLSSEFKDIAYSSELDMIVILRNVAETNISYSTDNLETITTISSSTNGSIQLEKICWAGALNKFYALVSDYNNDNSKLLAESVDGITWTFNTIFAEQATSSPLFIKWFSATNKLIVGRSGGLDIKVSENGLDWTDSLSSSYINDIVFVPSLTKFYAVGNNICEVSSDGVNWTSLSNFSNYIWNCVTYSTTHNCLLLSSNSSYCYTTNNGVTWTTYVYTNTSLNHSGVIWDNIYECFISSNGHTFNLNSWKYNFSVNKSILKKPLYLYNIDKYFSIYENDIYYHLYSLTKDSYEIISKDNINLYLSSLPNINNNIDKTTSIQRFLYMKEFDLLIRYDEFNIYRINDAASNDETLLCTVPSSRSIISIQYNTKNSDIYIMTSTNLTTTNLTVSYLYILYNLTTLSSQYYMYGRCDNFAYIEHKNDLFIKAKSPYSGNTYFYNVFNLESLTNSYIASTANDYNDIGFLYIKKLNKIICHTGSRLEIIDINNNYNVSFYGVLYINSINYYTITWDDNLNRVLILPLNNTTSAYNYYFESYNLTTYTRIYYNSPYILHNIQWIPSLNIYLSLTAINTSDCMFLYSDNGLDFLPFYNNNFNFSTSYNTISSYYATQNSLYEYIPELKYLYFNVGTQNGFLYILDGFPSYDINSLLSYKYESLSNINKLYSNYTEIKVLTNNFDNIIYSNSFKTVICLSNSNSAIEKLSITYNGGKTWIDKTTTNSKGLYKLAESDSLICIVGDNTILTSSDCINWEEQTPPISTVWNSICYNNELDKFYLTGNNKLFSSTDCITWTEITLPVSKNWINISYAYEINKLCMITNNFPGNQIYTSIDGITWESSISDFSIFWKDMCWYSKLNKFIAVSGNYICYTNDDFSWTMKLIKSNNWQKIIYDDYLELLFIISNDDTDNVGFTKDLINWNYFTIDVENFMGFCHNPYYKNYIIITLTKLLKTNIYEISYINSEFKTFDNLTFENNNFNVNSTSTDDILRFNNTNDNSSLSISINATTSTTRDIVLTALNDQTFNFNYIYGTDYSTTTYSGDGLNIDSNLLNLFGNITYGTVNENKIVSTDVNGNISNINKLITNKIYKDDKLLFLNSDLNNSYITGITPGTAYGNKAIVLDENKDIEIINSITTSNINVDNSIIYNNNINSNLVEYRLIDNYGINVITEINSFIYVSAFDKYFIGGNTSKVSTTNRSYKYLFSSTNLVNWEQVVLDSFISSTSTDSYIYDIYYSNVLDMLLISLENGDIVYTTDGINFSEYYTGNSTYNRSIVFKDFNSMLIMIIKYNDTNGYYYNLTYNNNTFTKTLITNSGLYNTNIHKMVFIENNVLNVLSHYLQYPTKYLTYYRVYIYKINSSSTLTNEQTLFPYSESYFPSTATIVSFISNDIDITIIVLYVDDTVTKVYCSNGTSTWTEITGISLIDKWHNGIYKDGVFYLDSGIDDTKYIYSNDGLTWTLGSKTISITNNNYTINNGIYYTVDRNNGIYKYGSNYYDYEQILSHNSYKTDVIYINTIDKYISIDNNTKTIKESSDLLNWKIIFDNNLLNYYQIIWCENLSMAIVMCGTELLYTYDFENWISVTLSSSGKEYKYIAWSPSLNIFVIINDNSLEGEECIKTSSDCITWNNINIGDGYVWKNILWYENSEIFIAVCNIKNNYNILYSSDGTNWNFGNITYEIDNINSVKILNNDIVILADNYIYITSKYDGIWSKCSMTNSYDSTYLTNVVDIDYINTLDIYICFSGFISSSSNNIFTSTDLSSWNPINNSDLFNKYTAFKKIYYNYYKNELIIYTDEENPYPGINDYIYKEVDNSANIYNSKILNIENVLSTNITTTNNTSTFISNLSTIQTDSFAYNFKKVIYLSDKKMFYGIEKNSNGVYYTYDLSYWVKTYSYTYFTNCLDIAYNKESSSIIISGLSNNSSYPSVYKNYNIPSNSVTIPIADDTKQYDTIGVSVYNTLNIFISKTVPSYISYGSYYLTSLNGSSNAFSLTNGFEQILWVNSLNKFIAISPDNGADKIAISDDDGFTWSFNNCSNNESLVLRSVVYNTSLELFVIVGDSGCIVTSPDGVTWTTQTAYNTSNYTNVIYIEDENVLIAASNSAIMYSEDAITWNGYDVSIGDEDVSLLYYNYTKTLYAFGNSVIASTEPFKKNSIDTSTMSYNFSINDNLIGIGTNDPTNTLTVIGKAYKPSTTAWTISSDERIKDDIVNADLSLCYNLINSLRLVKYKWKDEYIEKNKIEDINQLGWIAQEVQELLPNSVKSKKMFNYDDCLSLNIDQIISHLYGTVQYLISKYESQENIMNELNTNISSIEEFINKLKN